MANPSYARAKLYTNYKMEQAAEEQAWEDYFNAKDSDALASDVWSLVGGIVGGGIGFFVGGPYTAYMGYQAGKQAKYLNPEETSGGPEEWFAEKGIDMREGLFEQSMYENQLKDVELLEAEEDLAELIGTGTDFVSAYFATDGFSPDKVGIGVTGFAEDAKWYNPATWTDEGSKLVWDRGKTISGKAVPTVKEFINEKTKGLIGIDDTSKGIDSISENAEGFIDSEIAITPDPGEIRPDFASFNYYDDSPWDSYIRQTRSV